MAKKKVEIKIREILINDKFIYSESIYKLWKNGASLIREKTYSSATPIKTIPKEKFMKDYKDYKLVRFFNLEACPEDWAKKNGYSPITN